MEKVFRKKGWLLLLLIFLLWGGRLSSFSVNLDPLRNQIAAAKQNLNSVQISEDGENVYESRQWVNQQTHETYRYHIEERENEMPYLQNNAEVQEAIEMLQEATSEFNHQKQWGRKPVPVVLDKSGLRSEIKIATANLETVQISEEGEEVEETKQWVTQKAYHTYQEAKSEAEHVLENAGAQYQLDRGTEALKKATAKFNQEKKYGSKKIDLSLLLTEIEKAQEQREGVEISSDGQDVYDDTFWVTKEKMGAYQSVIQEAQKMAEKPAGQRETDEMTKRLSAAIEEFKAAKKLGKRPSFETQTAHFSIGVEALNLIASGFSGGDAFIAKIQVNFEEAMLHVTSLQKGAIKLTFFDPEGRRAVATIQISGRGNIQLDIQKYQIDVQKIEIRQRPQRRVFWIGETFDFEGLILCLTGACGEEAMVPLAQFHEFGIEIIIPPQAGYGEVNITLLHAASGQQTDFKVMQMAADMQEEDEEKEKPKPKEKPKATPTEEQRKAIEARLEEGEMNPEKEEEIFEMVDEIIEGSLDEILAAIQKDREENNFEGNLKRALEERIQAEFERLTGFIELLKEEESLFERESEQLSQWIEKVIQAGTGMQISGSLQREGEEEAILASITPEDLQNQYEQQRKLSEMLLNQTDGPLQVLLERKVRPKLSFQMKGDLKEQALFIGLPPNLEQLMKDFDGSGIQIRTDLLQYEIPQNALPGLSEAGWRLGVKKEMPPSQTLPPDAEMVGEMPVFSLMAQDQSGGEIEFASPIKMKIPISNIEAYTEEELSQDLVAYRLDEASGMWVPVGGRYCPETKSFEFYRMHFSKYTVLKTKKSLITTSKTNLKSEVNQFLGKGILSQDSAFEPDQKIKKGEFVAWVAKAYGVDMAQYKVDTSSVDKAHPYYKEIMAAQSVGLILGDGNKFDPDSILSQQEMAVILSRASQQFGGGKKAENMAAFLQNLPGGAKWAEEGLAQMKKDGVMTFETGNLTGEVSKEEALSALYKLYQRS